MDVGRWRIILEMIVPVILTVDVVLVDGDAIQPGMRRGV
jgi:hypothetical protein